ncbi:MAG: type II toxin-antitoxin system VapC family toxin [Gammaproteobacteria bacterium]|nr:type II toxin-antitoxin system VapC family toxin [Gammaproteobacteria bacterium]
MKLLLDTHILLWLIYSPDKLPSHWLSALKNPDNQLYVSHLSYWEIALKYSLGKLTLKGATPEDIPTLAQRMGITSLGSSAQVLASIHQSPLIEGHKDPFDRALIWTAIYEQLTLVSHDQKMNDYHTLGLSLLK